jgi:hypothetical protein
MPLFLVRGSEADSLARPQHGDADDDHHDSEQHDQALPVDGLAYGGPDQRADGAGGGEHRGLGPAHVAHPPVTEKVDKGIGRDRQRAGA